MVLNAIAWGKCGEKKNKKATMPLQGPCKHLLDYFCGERATGIILESRLPTVVRTVGKGCWERGVSSVYRKKALRMCDFFS